MILTVDIGNTNTTLGFFKDNRLINRKDFPTGKICSQKDKLKKLTKNYVIEDCIVCSVVPKVENKLNLILKSLLRKKPLIVGRDIKLPVKNKYKNPKEVGIDRLVNAFGGSLLYKNNLILIDFGTAVTFDVVTKKREYLGGLILPGLKLSLDALYEKTALLPKVRLSKPKGLIGRTTKESILNGVVYGFSALTDDIVLRLAKNIKGKYSVVATGGSASLLKKYAKRIDYVEDNLTLKSIFLLYTYYHEKN